MSTGVIGIAMEHVIPAGAFGPEPVTLDVRAYLVPHESGLVLVDSGMQTTGQALDTEPLLDGDVVATLRVFATPGHTPGHVSLIDESRGDQPWDALDLLIDR